jgi:DNA-binding HxlR family transcriptional regulator
VENELTELGRGIVDVADTVEAWLARAPQGPIVFGSEAAKGAIRALVAGWGSTVLQALAARPLSLTELDSIVTDMSYPSLERRLSAMRAVRQVELLSGEGGVARPYAVTEWTRQAVGPLVAAGRCECEYLAETTDPLTRLDIEAALMLALPLVELPPVASGSCVLSVVPDHEGAIESLASVEVGVEQGEVVSCVPRAEPEPETWATGPVESWVTVLLEGRLDGVNLGGDDAQLVSALVEGMHRSLGTALADSPPDPGTSAG